MILIGLGANLPSRQHGPPRATLCAALKMLDARGVRVQARSSWYESAPVPPSDQSWFVNAVATVATELAPAVLLRTLHDVESALGRVRGDARNAPRAADLDLLDYDGRVSAPDDWPRLPHPRLHERAFVLRPLLELAPDWRHPVRGLAAGDLLRRLPDDQPCLRVPEPACRPRP